MHWGGEEGRGRHQNPWGDAQTPGDLEETAETLGTPRGQRWDHWRRSATLGTLEELVFGFLVHAKEQKVEGLTVFLLLGP